MTEFSPLAFLAGLIGRKQNSLANLGGNAPPLEHYPTGEEAAYAQRYGFGQGDPRLDAYVQGQANRIMATPRRGGGYTPFSGAEIEDPVSAVNELPMQHPAPFGTQDVYARAALAANRIPIAKLGFDPGRMVQDVTPQETNIAGLYDPKQDAIYFHNPTGIRSTPVHEAIHRGLEILRKDPANAELFKNVPNEEYAVRYLMATQAGNPEQGTGDIADAQRANALRLYGDLDFYGGHGRKQTLDALTRAAEEAIKNRNPRGPR